jgi:hypothetical protein
MDKVATAVGREERRAWWRVHVEGQARSGVSVKAYCAEHGLKTWQWHYWRKALARPAGGFVELHAASGPLTLECAGCRIAVSRGFDPELLHQVLAVLRAS